MKKSGLLHCSKNGVKPFTRPDGGDEDREDMLWDGLWSFPFVKRPPPVHGVGEGDEDALGFELRRASDAARNSKLVVPNAFVEPERAEQTTATLCSSMYFLLKG
jgi:hypothetical protein